ncbi:hypothetical protein SDC9_151965 [bioreactor metagenome]|uniref:Uncharacterized protein n=1 Tax=bioreactor metagenome TaxID=1076179 RepID=A0A645ETH8_9ZZZZ
MRRTAVFRHQVSLRHQVVQRGIHALLRPADARKILQRLLIVALLGLIQNKLIGNPLVLRAVGELADANIGGDLLRIFRTEQHAEKAAIGVPNHVDLLLMEPLAQIVHDEARVLNAGIHVHRLLCLRGGVALARATLVEADDGAFVRQRRLIHQYGMPVAGARTAMEKQHHGVRLLGSAHANVQQRAVDREFFMQIDGIAALHA